MKVGQSVTYLNDGHGRPATVRAIVGAGASGFKRLNLALSPTAVVLDVPHENDAAPGDDCWTLDASRQERHPPPMIGRRRERAANVPERRSENEADGGDGTDDMDR